MSTLTIVKHCLLQLLLKALAFLPLTDAERQMIVNAYEISFETHLRAPVRATGEIYFLHIFRQVIRVIQMMVLYEVVSAELICAILLHDTVEDAEKGKTTPFMVTSKIQLLVSDYTALCVQTLTKNKGTDTRETYLVRIVNSNLWHVLVAKPFDGEDNTKTLAATDIKNQPMKVREIFVHYPEMRNRAINILTTLGEKGELPKWESWIALVKHIHRDLRRHAWRQLHRLERMNIEVV